MKRGAVPVEESLKLALQIAEALEAAHEKGVIHRDLKPLNIKVTPDGKVKVLDFGLAKAFAGDGSDVKLSQSPTLSMAATQQGVILGTAAYMSPEQARGEATDKRADIWAFGVVLFEMLTGTGTFDGRTVSDVLAEVLARQPNWDGLPLNLHSRIRLLLERCLEKEAKDRYHDIADVRVDIQKVLADPGGVIVQPDVIQAPQRPILRWVALAVVLSVIVAGVAVWNLKPQPPGSVARFDYDLPEEQQFRRAGRPVFALSPDGRHFVYNTATGLYLRSLDELEARLISGTEGDLANPFFSPDGQWVGYFSVGDGQLKKIAVAGGAPVTLCEAEPPFGASWGIDDTIVFGQRQGVMSVSANGGTPELLVATEQGEQVHGPRILPDGKSVLFTLATTTGANRWDEAQIVVQMLDTGERTVLVNGGSDAHYIPTGHLVYAVAGVLFALPFDLASLEITGGPVPIVEGVQRAVGRAANTASANFGVSDDGLLAYVAGPAAGGAGPTQLLWIDRQGREELIPTPSRNFANPFISPDGTRVGLYAGDQEQDVWIWDFGREVLTRFTFDPAIDRIAIWDPQEERIFFRSERDGASNIYWKRADGTGQVERLTTSSNRQVPSSITPDGSTLIYEELIPGNDLDLFMIPVDGGEAQVLLETQHREEDGRLSPDGRWLAYMSNESGQTEVYVRPFPEVDGGKWQVSTGGGAIHQWSPRGDEIFYRSSGLNWVAPIQTDPTFVVGNAEPWPNSQWGSYFAVSPNAERLLLTRPDDSGPDASAGSSINIVLNWFEELKERVPVP